MTIICVFYSMLCICIFSIYYTITSMPYNKDAVFAGLNTNLMIYVLMLGSIYLIFLLLFLLYEKKKDSFTPIKYDGFFATKKQAIDHLSAIILFTIGILFFYKIYSNENYIYPYWSGRYYIREQVSKPMYSMITCALFVHFVLFSRNSNCSRTYIRITFGIIVALLCSFLAYAPNPFFDKGGGLYHIHAYTNSIINIARFKPYDQYNLSIYGHYALLYLPIVKVLGNDYTAVALSISIATFITYFCSFVICSKTIENDWCYVLTVTAICAVTVMFYSGGQYYQVNPHRLLFPIITLFAVLLFLDKKPRLIMRWGLELLLGSMALIWNIETGLFAIVTFCVFNIMTDDENRIQSVLKCIVLLTSCFALSYTVVNFYNFLVGAETWMTWKRFIYPIGSDTYSINSLTLEFPTPYSVFVLQMMVFLLALMNATIHLKENRSEHYKNSRILLACTAISGLGSLSYFANRAAYSNIAISCIQMLVIAGIYGSEAINEIDAACLVEYGYKRNDFRVSGKLLMLFCVFIFAMETTLSFGNTISNRISTTWKTEELHLFLNEMNEMIPDETVGMGKGVPELFFQLGRDPMCVLTDWSDMNDENIQEAFRILYDHDGFLFVNKNTNMNIKKADYKVICEKIFGDDTYTLYKKTTPSA